MPGVPLGGVVPTFRPPRLKSPPRSHAKPVEDAEDGQSSGGLITTIKQRTLIDEDHIPNTIEERDEEKGEEEAEENDQEADEYDLDDSASHVSSVSPDDLTDDDFDTDLEMDEERWLHPEKFERDPKGVKKYLKACQDAGLQPVTYIVKHIQDTQLIMRFHGLGPAGMKALVEPLEMNTTIEKLDFEGNHILGEGARYLSRVLRENVYVTELILADNKIGNAGARCVCDLLCRNKTLVYVNLTGNDIDDSVAELFCDMLTQNTDIKTLVLRQNSFEDKGAELFQTAMNDNDTLETLDLSWNHFHPKGCILLIEGLKENVGLRYFSLSMNGLGVEGSKALAESLEANCTLTELDISYCRISAEGAKYIASGLAKNENLQKLNIGYNPLGAEGGLVILSSVDSNESSAIILLNFGGLMVKQDFVTIQERLEEERGLCILYGGVILDIPRFRRSQTEPWIMTQKDPMSKLRDFVERAGYQLVDFLRSLDRDQSFTISKHDLSAMLKGSDIGMTDKQVDVLMDQLDKDGNNLIDFSDLIEGNQDMVARRDTRRNLTSRATEDEADRERRILEDAAGEFRDLDDDC